MTISTRSSKLDLRFSKPKSPSQPFLFCHTTLQRSIGWQDKNWRILETRMNQVLKYENRVLCYEKPAVFIFTTWKDFEKNNNNHSHVQWMHWPTGFVWTISVKFKFLMIKRTSEMFFILKFGKLFQYNIVSSLSFELWKLFFIFVKVCIYVRWAWQCKLDCVAVAWK